MGKTGTASLIQGILNNKVLKKKNNENFKNSYIYYTLGFKTLGFIHVSVKLLRKFTDRYGEKKQN